MDLDINKKADLEARAADGLSVRAVANLDAERVVGSVLIRPAPVAGVAQESIAIDADVIERAADIVRKLRNAAGDLRYVCVDHGYYDVEGPHYDCPVCGRNAKAAAKPKAELKVAPEPAAPPAF